MSSAFGVEHVSKMVTRADQVNVRTRKGEMVRKPKGKLRRIKAGTVNATTKLGTAAPSPVAIAARSVTPLRHVLHG